MGELELLTYDLQTIHWDRGELDVSYSLMTSVKPNVIERHLPELVRTYHEALLASPGHVPQSYTYEECMFNVLSTATNWSLTQLLVGFEIAVQIRACVLALAAAGTSRRLFCYVSKPCSVCSTPRRPSTSCSTGAPIHSSLRHYRWSTAYDGH